MFFSTALIGAIESMDNEDRDFIGNRVRIYPRGVKGTYCADFWADGKHCRRSLKTRNRKAAVDRAVALANSLQEGTYQSRGPEVTTPRRERRSSPSSQWKVGPRTPAHAMQPNSARLWTFVNREGSCGFQK